MALIRMTYPITIMIVLMVLITFVAFVPQLSAWLVSRTRFYLMDEMTKIQSLSLVRRKVERRVWSECILKHDLLNVLCEAWYHCRCDKYHRFRHHSVKLVPRPNPFGERKDMVRWTEVPCFPETLQGVSKLTELSETLFRIQWNGTSLQQMTWRLRRNMAWVPGKVASNWSY